MSAEEFFCLERSGHYGTDHERGEAPQATPDIGGTACAAGSQGTTGEGSRGKAQSQDCETSLRAMLLQRREAFEKVLSENGIQTERQLKEAMALLVLGL